MQRFSAQVARDPKGYVWVHLGGYGPEDGTKRFAASLVLQANSHQELVRRWRKEGVVLRDAYDPFVQEPALFRIFASLPPTPEAILEFANRYGDLARPEVILEDDGMSLAEWRAEIDAMRASIRTADAYLARSRGQRSIIPFLDAILSEVPVFLSASEQHGMLRLRTQVDTLMVAMKLQLVLSIVEHKHYRTCEQCQKPFEVTPQVNRSDRIYCSDNCRVKAYQRRRKQAIALRHAGRTLREIAKAVGSDMATVKKWVEEEK
jgi:hypothetical protein